MGRILTEDDYRNYIDAFNRDDYAGFGDYYQEDVVLTIAGKRELRGRQAIFVFYLTVKALTRRAIQVRRVIVGENQLAAEVESEFLALQDVPEFPGRSDAQGRSDPGDHVCFL